jgi:hypothetical protein
MQRKSLSDSRGKVRLRSLADLDGRTAAAKAAFALRDAIAADLGGADRLSAMQAAIVNSAGLIGAMLDHLGAQYLAGDKIDRLEFATLTNAQRRLLADLGLHRKARDITPPSLKAYVKGRVA